MIYRISRGIETDNIGGSGNLFGSALEASPKNAKSGYLESGTKTKQPFFRVRFFSSVRGAPRQSVFSVVQAVK